MSARQITEKFQKHKRSAIRNNKLSRVGYARNVFDFSKIFPFVGKFYNRLSHSAFRNPASRLTSELFEDFIITLLYQTRPREVVQFPQTKCMRVPMQRSCVCRSGSWAHSSAHLSCSTPVLWLSHQASTPRQLFFFVENLAAGAHEKLSNLSWNLFEKIIKLMKWLMILISLTYPPPSRRKSPSAILLKNIWKIYATGKKVPPKQQKNKKGCEREQARSCLLSGCVSRRAEWTFFTSLVFVFSATRKSHSPVPHQQLNVELVMSSLHPRCLQLSRVGDDSHSAFSKRKRWRRNFKKTMKKTWKSCGWNLKLILCEFYSGEKRAM